MKIWILGIWLGLEGVWDLKYKEIPLWFSLAGGCAGLLFCIDEKRELLQILLAILPGILLLLFSWITKEVIGYGDGLTVLVLGMYMSLSQMAVVGVLAFGVAGVVALALLVFCKKTGGYRMPFIPFLGIATGIVHLVELGGL